MGVLDRTPGEGNKGDRGWWHFGVLCFIMLNFIFPFSFFLSFFYILHAFSSDSLHLSKTSYHLMLPFAFYLRLLKSICSCAPKS